MLDSLIARSACFQVLGVPIALGRLHVIDWAKLEEKYAKKRTFGKGFSIHCW
jgi:hypothetical protein